MFLHRLAITLGKTVEEIKYGMSAEELADWMVFAEDEPIGYMRLDFNFASLTSAVYNASGNFKKATRATDFMPFLKSHSNESAEKRKVAAKAKTNPVAVSVFTAFNKAASGLRVRYVKVPKSNLNPVKE